MCKLGLSLKTKKKKKCRICCHKMMCFYNLVSSSFWQRIPRGSTIDCGSEALGSLHGSPIWLWDGVTAYWKKNKTASEMGLGKAFCSWHLKLPPQWKKCLAASFGAQFTLFGLKYPTSYQAFNSEHHFHLVKCHRNRLQLLRGLSRY